MIKKNNHVLVRIFQYEMHNEQENETISGIIKRAIDLVEIDEQF